MGFLICAAALAAALILTAFVLKGIDDGIARRRTARRLDWPQPRSPGL